MLDGREFLAASVVSSAALAASQAVAAPPAELIKTPWTDEGVVNRGGGVIHFVSVGTGPAVVLMPKLGGWAADWRHIAPALAEKYRVVVIEPPGHGGSKMATAAPYIQTVPESAAMVRATLDELGIQPYALGGNSLGGCISVIMAGLWPEEIPRLILLSVSLAANRPAPRSRRATTRWRPAHTTRRAIPFPGRFPPPTAPSARPNRSMTS
jgi:pimeloyl-ACP methyl ester carboxylesterase